MVTIPRLVIAAPASGHGKTSVATGLLAAYRRAGLTVSPHKVGPDYIDPGYHTLAAGRVGRNLDPWLVGEQRIQDLFVHGACTPTLADIAVIEGVMGLFDGAVGRGRFASTAHVAQLLKAPVVLVVDCTGTGASVAALVHGFATLDPSVKLGGVILNQVGSDRHERILIDALNDCGIPVLGSIRRHAALATPSRHLGLIPAAERHDDAERTVAALGAAIADSLDLAALAALARTAPPLPSSSQPPQPLDGSLRGPRPIVAIAAGAAFTFSYAEHAELLTAAGADVVPFDPLHDEAPPDGCSGLIIGGGFPEIHAETLAANTRLHACVHKLVTAGTPIAAECAGLLYLARSLNGHPMAAVLDIDAQMSDHLTLGYRDAVAVSDSCLAPAGTRVHGHEFHRTTCQPGHGPTPAWTWAALPSPEDPRPGPIQDGFTSGHLHASYLHLHWSGLPGAADRFVATCRSRMAVPA